MPTPKEIAKKHGVPRELAAIIYMLGDIYRDDERLIRWPKKKKIIGGYGPQEIVLRDANFKEISSGYLFLTSKRLVYYPLEPKLSGKESVKAALGIATLDPTEPGLSPFMTSVKNIIDVKQPAENYIQISFNGGKYGLWSDWEFGDFGTWYTSGGNKFSLDHPGVFIVGEWRPKETVHIIFPAVEEKKSMGLETIYDVDGWIKDIRALIKAKVKKEKYEKKEKKKTRRKLRYCPRCEAEVEPEDNYCTQCGYKLR